MGRTTLIPSKAKMAVPKKMGKDSGLESENRLDIFLSEETEHQQAFKIRNIYPEMISQRL